MIAVSDSVATHGLPDGRYTVAGQDYIVPVSYTHLATAFADPDNEAKVQASFAQLAKGKTVLMIAHRLATVANADCIYVVQDGQIVESGTKDELCAQDVYKRQALYTAGFRSGHAAGEPDEEHRFCGQQRTDKSIGGGTSGKERPVCLCACCGAS